MVGKRNEIRKEGRMEERRNKGGGGEAQRKEEGTRKERGKNEQGAYNMNGRRATEPTNGHIRGVSCTWVKQTKSRSSWRRKEGTRHSSRQIHCCTTLAWNHSHSQPSPRCSIAPRHHLPRHRCRCTGCHVRIPRVCSYSRWRSRKHPSLDVVKKPRQASRPLLQNSLTARWRYPRPYLYHWWEHLLFRAVDKE